MNKLQALHSFFGSFGLTAYVETAVPDSATLPYLTYESTLSDFRNTAFVNASLWYYGSSMTAISEKTLAIEQRLKNGGEMIQCDDGAIWVRMSSPFAQSMSDENDMIRRVVLSFNIDYI